MLDVLPFSLLHQCLPFESIQL